MDNTPDVPPVKSMGARIKDRVVGLKDRLSVPVTKDGRFAVDAMQDRVRARLKVALADPELRPLLDLPPAAPAPTTTSAPFGLDTNDLCIVLYDALSAAAVKIAANNGYTEQQAAVLALEPGERAKLIPLTGKVLTKYLPPDVGKYQEEMALAFALLAIVSGKVALLRAQTINTNVVPMHEHKTG